MKGDRPSEPHAAVTEDAVVPDRGRLRLRTSRDFQDAVTGPVQDPVARRPSGGKWTQFFLVVNKTAGTHGGAAGPVACQHPPPWVVGPGRESEFLLNHLTRKGE